MVCAVDINFGNLQNIHEQALLAFDVRFASSAPRPARGSVRLAAEAALRLASATEAVEAAEAAERLAEARRLWRQCHAATDGYEQTQ